MPPRANSPSCPVAPRLIPPFTPQINSLLYSFARSFKSARLEDLGEKEIAEFLNQLALDERLSASSQRQALNALVFLYREVFNKQLGDFSDFRRAKVRAHLPYDIRTVQKLLGHQSVETTQIYTHVMARPGLGVKSPIDFGFWILDFGFWILDCRRNHGTHEPHEKAPLAMSRRRNYRSTSREPG